MRCCLVAGGQRLEVPAEALAVSWPGGRQGCSRASSVGSEGRMRAGRPLSKILVVSALTLLDVAASSAAEGQVRCRWSLALRPEKASRPAT
jgi:hypothetical protein